MGHSTASNDEKTSLLGGSSSFKGQVRRQRTEPLPSFFLGAGMAKLLGRFYRGKCHYRVHRDDFLGREKIMIPTIVVKTSRAVFGASTCFAVVCSSANQCRFFLFVSINVIHKTELETW